MTGRRPESEVDIPSVQRCPNCGEPVFLGELECSHCGHNMASLEDRARAINPFLVAGLALVIGMMISITGLGQDGIVSFLMILVGVGLVIGGGLFWAASFLLNDPTRRRD